MRSNERGFFELLRQLRFAEGQNLSALSDPFIMSDVSSDGLVVSPT